MTNLQNGLQRMVIGFELRINAQGGPRSMQMEGKPVPRLRRGNVASATMAKTWQWRPLNLPTCARAGSD